MDNSVAMIERIKLNVMKKVLVPHPDPAKKM